MSGVLIVGAGAIGQWLGTLLPTPDISMLVRPRQLSTLKTTARLFSELTAGQHFEDVIFTVKAFQVEEAAAQVRDSGVTVGRVWGFQNGMGSDELLSAAFPQHWFGAMTTTVPVYLTPDGIQPGKKGGLAWATKNDLSQAPAWVRSFKRVERVDSLKCSKLLLNITCNASCALLDMLPRQVVRHQDMFSFELGCLREFLKVVKACQIPLVALPGYRVPQMAALSSMPDFMIRGILGGKIERARGNKPPSLLMDLRSGRPHSEVDVLNGAVVELGKRCGIPTPGNAWLHHSLKQVVLDPSQWSRYRGRIDEVAEQALQALSVKETS